MNKVPEKRAWVPFSGIWNGRNKYKFVKGRLGDQKWNTFETSLEYKRFWGLDCLKL